jgi:hypothetical protein
MNPAIIKIAPRAMIPTAVPKIEASPRVIKVTPIRNRIMVTAPMSTVPLS